MCAYHREEGGLISTLIHLMLRKVKQAPILILILVGVGIASTTATPATHQSSALMVGKQNFRELSSPTELDPGHLQSSLSRLESHADSLKKVVLQN